MSVAVDRLVWVVAQLREHCPWTRRLTHAVLTARTPGPALLTGKA